MLEKLRLYKSFFKAQKDGFNGSFQEYEKLVIKEKIIKKEMPVIYGDEDGSNVYRLIPLKKVNGQYITNRTSFYLERPEGMSQEEVFKVIAHNLSYFVMYYSSSNFDIVGALESVLGKMYGFNSIIKEDIKGREVVDLCFLYDYDLSFVNSPFYKNHFPWFENNRYTSEEEIIAIYERINPSLSKKLRDGQ